MFKNFSLTVNVGELANFSKAYQSPLFLANILQDNDLMKVAKQVWKISKSSAGIGPYADCLMMHWPKVNSINFVV